MSDDGKRIGRKEAQEAQKSGWQRTDDGGRTADSGGQLGFVNQSYSLIDTHHEARQVAHGTHGRHGNPGCRSGKRELFVQTRSNSSVYGSEYRDRKILWVGNFPERTEGGRRKSERSSH